MPPLPKRRRILGDIANHTPSAVSFDLVRIVSDPKPPPHPTEHQDRDRHHNKEPGGKHQHQTPHRQGNLASSSASSSTHTEPRDNNREAHAESATSENNGQNRDPHNESGDRSRDPLNPMNTSGSAIPTLKKPSRYERFLSINESLNRKAHIPQFQPAAKPAANHTAPLLDEAERLESQVQSAAHELSLVQEEADQLRLLHRALGNETVQICAAIRDLDAKFDYLSAQITAKVELREREINLDLQHYKNQAESSFNDAKDDLEYEIEAAASFDDQPALDAVKALRESRDALAAELQAALDAKSAQIEREQADFHAQQERCLSEQAQRVEAASAELRALQSDADASAAAHRQTLARLASHKTATDDLQSRLEHARSTADSFEAVKSDLEAQIVHAKSRLRDAQASESEWNARVAEARRACDLERAKFADYVQTRRHLENAIMSYGSKRAYLRILSGEERQVAGSCSFDKVTWGTAADYAEEWRLFVQQSSVAALVFSGASRPNFSESVEAVFSFLSDAATGGRFYLQSIVFGSDAPQDILNSSSEVELHFKQASMELVSQRMLVQTRTDISSTIRQHDGSTLPQAHLFTSKNAADTTKSVLLLNLSPLSLAQQTEVLSSPESKLGALFRYAARGQILHICDIEHPETSEALLEAISNA